MYSAHVHTKILFIIALQACATPIINADIGSILLPRTNPCEPGGTPILYNSYGTDQCPAKNGPVQADGSCPMTPYGGQDCQAYCEVRQSFFYDEEVPVVNNPYCHGPLTCTVTTSQSWTWTYSGTVVGGIDFDVLNIGVTGGLSYASAQTQLQSTSIDLNSTSCGYFTFLPILHESWCVMYLAA